MRGSSDGDGGGMWWLGSGATDPPPPERRREPEPLPSPERDYREVSAEAGQYPPPQPGNSSPYLARAHDEEPLGASVPRASRPPVPPPPPGTPLRASTPLPPQPLKAKPKPKRRRRASWPARLGLLFLAIVVGSVALAVWRGESGYGLSLPLGLGQPQATPTRIGFARQAKITFAPATQAITVPAATFVAATDGTGQVTAKQVTATATGTSAQHAAVSKAATQVIVQLQVQNPNSGAVTSVGGLQITSEDGKVSCTLEALQNPVPGGATVTQNCDEPALIEPAETWKFTDKGTGLFYSGASAAGGNPPGYVVPNGCGTDAPGEAQGDANTKLKSQMAAAIPAGSVVFYQPAYDLNLNSLSCAPAAGAFQTTAFSYTASVKGTAIATYFLAADAQSYQTTQLQKQVPANFVLQAKSQVCPGGPTVGTGATATKATVTCAATGTANWNWTPDALSQLGQSVAGLGLGSATLQLNQTQGIAPGSAKITLVDGSLLPSDPTTITFTVAAA